MDDKFPVFCYGSNNISRLALRLGYFDFDTERAFLKGYKRVFRGYSRNWGGAVATLIKSPSCTVFGFVAYLTYRDLNILDAHEGVRQDVYKRTSIPVNVNGVLEDCIVYIKCNDKEIGRPSTDYLQEVVSTISLYWKNDDGSEVTINNINVS